MPKIRDSDSGNNKDKSGDNTSATNYAFLIKFCLTISIENKILKIVIVIIMKSIITMIGILFA